MKGLVKYGARRLKLKEKPLNVFDRDAGGEKLFAFPNAFVKHRFANETEVQFDVVTSHLRIERRFAVSKGDGKSERGFVIAARCRKIVDEELWLGPNERRSSGLVAFFFSHWFDSRGKRLPTFESLSSSDNYLGICQLEGTVQDLSIRESVKFGRISTND